MIEFVKKNAIAVGSAASFAVILGIFWTQMQWAGLSFTVRMQDLAGLMAPLAFAAAVVERAVEILLSPWRDAEASKLDKRITAIQNRKAEDPVAIAQKEADLKAASEALDEYRGKTQKFAFAVSILVSTCVAIAGVRVLQPFLDSNKSIEAFQKAHPAQFAYFLSVDVGLTTALLAGGADGVHSVMNAVTTFFNTTADNTSKASQQKTT